METFMTDKPVSIHNITLIPVVCHRIHSYYNAMTPWVYANKEPMAIIICDANGTRAFDMSAKEISITSLSKIIPDINTLLLSHSSLNNP